MALRYRLPDGATFDARGEADSDWNGFPVPILDEPAYTTLQELLLSQDAAYEAEYVDDGKVTAGYYCDGLQWERADV